MSSKQQFEQGELLVHSKKVMSDPQTGYKAPVQQQPWPGKQSLMEDSPSTEYLPTPDGGYELYKPAGKLQGRNAIITGGDSGIGRSIAVLYAMEGVKNILIAYLAEEEEDAQDTKKLAEKYGASVVLLPTDLAKKENCKKVIDTAMEKFGSINILVNNHGVQMMRENILEIPE